MEYLPQDRVVGLLGHITLGRCSTVSRGLQLYTVAAAYLSCCMEGGDVVLHYSHYPLLGVLIVWDAGDTADDTAPNSSHSQDRKCSNSPGKDVWVCKDLGIHFQKRPLFQDEGGQGNLGEVHAQPHLGQHVHDKALVLSYNAWKKGR